MVPNGHGTVSGGLEQRKEGRELNRLYGSPKETTQDFWKYQRESLPRGLGSCIISKATLRVGKGSPMFKE